MTSADAILIDYEVTLQGLAWVSERKGLPKSQDDTEGDFIASKSGRPTSSCIGLMT